MHTYSHTYINSKWPALFSVLIELRSECFAQYIHIKWVWQKLNLAFDQYFIIGKQDGAFISSHHNTQANELNNVINIRGCNAITECQELWNHAGAHWLLPFIIAAASSTASAFSLSVPHHRGQSFIASVLGAGNIHWRSYTKVCSGAAHYYYMQEKGFYTKRESAVKSYGSDRMLYFAW